MRQNIIFAKDFRENFLEMLKTIAKIQIFLYYSYL